MNAGEATLRAISILRESDKVPVHETPALDVAILLSYTLNVSRSTLLAHPEIELSNLEKRFFALVEKRAQGIPVAYLIGKKEFWGLDFTVTHDVLIPKPDTEILVERALAIIREKEITRALDVCTGSGCIAVALKISHPELEITATDISGAAIDVAQINANRLLGLHCPTATAIRFLINDLRDGLPPANVHNDDKAHYNLVVSNPPYVPTGVTRQLLADGRNEPVLALDGGTNGLDLVRALIDNVPAILAPDGALLVETGEYNALSAADYLQAKGFRNVAVHRDLANTNRVIEGWLHE